MSSLYLDGLLDTDDHRRLEADRAKADLDHQHARREVERLHLIVRLLGTQASEGIQERKDERRGEKREVGVPTEAGAEYALGDHPGLGGRTVFEPRYTDAAFLRET